MRPRRQFRMTELLPRSFRLMGRTFIVEAMTSVPASMTLLPGDVIFTGAAPGVGPNAPGDTLRTRISRLGEMELRVR
jgi:2-keto-4-pentenoate hydratase/2-oxohepta-3-ene-1,7-dioic acid hydratase in catechol pathway